MEHSRSFLERVISSPDLAKVVPHLQPDVLCRAIQALGLADSGDLVALLTPKQISRILDMDLWRALPGGGEAFDADRFGAWIETLMQSGPHVAAEKLVGLDIELVVSGLSKHAAVFDYAAISGYETLDGDRMPGRMPEGVGVCTVGGYVLEPRRMASWESIVELLMFLAEEHARFFHRVMRTCVRLSNGAREEDGFHDLLEEGEQNMYDLASHREVRREEQGYVAPLEARGFLKSARSLALDAHAPAASPIALAYFRDLRSREANPAESSADPMSIKAPEDDVDPHTVAIVTELFRSAADAAVPPRALLSAGEPVISRLGAVQDHVRAHAAGEEELAFLTNVLISGSLLRGSPFDPNTASNAAASTCNLGLEHWPSHWAARDLVTAFQVGWRILHRDVCMFAAQRLHDALRTIRCTDGDVQVQLHQLRSELKRHVRDEAPWRAAESLDVILSLDTVAWAGMLSLINEFPLLHAAVASAGSIRQIKADDFRFIASAGDLERVRTFVESLPSRLSSA